jgi:CheY-like chemotaxis protein
MDPFSWPPRVKGMREQLQAVAPEADSGPSIDVVIIDSSSSDSATTADAIARVAPEAVIVRFDDHQQALRFIFGAKPPGRELAQSPRLILLDLGTPFTQGLHVLERLGSSATTCEIPIVVLNAVQDASAINGSYLFGASGFIVKPEARDSYCAEVEGIVARWLATPAGARHRPTMRSGANNGE